METSDYGVPPQWEPPQPIKEKLVEDLRTLAADMEDILKVTASQTGEQLSSVRAKAQESLRSARSRLAEAQAALSAKARATAAATARTADDYAREKPWHVVAMAAAAGLVIGMLIARR